jgi:hypothetical protein
MADNINVLASQTVFLNIYLETGNWKAKWPYADVFIQRLYNYNINALCYDSLWKADV